MGRRVRDANLETRTARSKLKSRGKPYYRAINPGFHVGYRKGKWGGVWVARYLADDGKYHVEKIAIADDVTDSDGIQVLNFAQAQNRARDRHIEQLREDAGLFSRGPYTVTDAIREYLEDYETRSGKNLADMRYRIDAYILPELGTTEVRKLTAAAIRKWQSKLVKMPPRVRSRMGESIRYRDVSEDPDSTRKRKVSVNKVMTIFKAALNHAWREGKVASDDAWRRVKPFKDVDTPRLRYLEKSECVRLVNGCDPNFRPMVQAALFTGCRYGELASLNVGDFNQESGTLHIRTTKTGKDRHVVLDDEGREFFEGVTAGRPRGEIMFPRPDGFPWGKSHQTRPIRIACQRAKITPAAGFHILRHTYASHLVMNGVPLPVVAQNLGHADTRMTERHYAHLAPSYVAEAIRAGAPKLGIGKSSNVAAMRPRGA